MLAQQRRDPAPLGALAELPWRLQHRYVGLSGTVVLDASSPDHAHLAIISDLSGEGFEHRRLADAGFTGEEDYLAPPLGGLLQSSMQLLQHTLTFDNGRRQLGVGSRQFLITAPWPLPPAVCRRLTDCCRRIHGHGCEKR